MAKFNLDKSDPIELDFNGKNYKVDKITQNFRKELDDGLRGLIKRIQDEEKDEEAQIEILENCIYAFFLSVAFKCDPTDFQDADTRELEKAWEFFQIQAFGKIVYGVVKEKIEEVEQTDEDVEKNVEGKEKE